MARARAAKQMEHRRIAAADLQGSSLPVHRDVGWLLAVRIIHRRLEELGTQVRRLDIDAGASVAEVQRGGGQAIERLRGFQALRPDRRGRSQDGVAQRGEHDDRGRGQSRDPGLRAGEGVIEDQLDPQDDEDEGPEVTQPLDGVRRHDLEVDQEKDDADRDQDDREEGPPSPPIHLSVGGGTGPAARWRSGQPARKRPIETH